MSTHNSLDEIKTKIDKSLTDITKSYILINFAYNTEEETKLYREEFEKRYINFYKLINNVEKEINEKFKNGINDSINRILNIDFYKPNMSFLDSFNFGDQLEEISNEIDEEYNKKTTISMVKMNFYHNNRSLFGPKTRFHLDTTKYGIIDPVPHGEEESIYAFSTVTSYYKSINNLKLEDKKTKIYKKDM